MTQKIPVTRDGKRGSEILLIDSHRVVKIDKAREREFIIHTKDNKYYLDLSIDSIEEWLYEDGFRLLDSGIIVNMNHVTEYDRRKGVVYLGDPLDQLTKTASAARIHKEHIENVMSLLKSVKNEELKGEIRESQESYLIPVKDGQFSRSYATIRAMYEKKQAEEKIVYMAYHDSMTNLPNRFLFQDKLKQAFEEAEAMRTMLAVVFLDLDRFKVINDTLGHHAGDRLLQYVANKLIEYVPDKGLIARFGGDEFMILLDNICDVSEVITFVNGIPGCLREPFFFDKQELYISSSIGISIYPRDGTDVESLIKNADVAMYRAKEKGGNTYEMYHPDMNHRSLHRLNLEIDLRKTVEREEFMVYYQPLVSLKTGSIFGMEALVRWDHPEWGMVSPGEFIPLAEETGLIVPLGNWVLRQACKQNRIWNLMGHQPLCVSVNISVNQFMQSGFVKFVEQTLHATGLSPNLLCLEITESVAMKNVAFIMDTMDKLKQLGVQISIDDFGTGYSSLSYLKRFRVHSLKIDQSFIRDVTTDEDNAAIVTALIAMSQQLKIRSLAEGVETQEQLEFLKEIGCKEIQGYIFSKPLPAHLFEQLIVDQKSLYPCNN